MPSRAGRRCSADLAAAISGAGWRRTGRRRPAGSATRTLWARTGREGASSRMPLLLLLESSTVGKAAPTLEFKPIRPLGSGPGDGKVGPAIEHRVALSVDFGPGVGKAGPALQHKPTGSLDSGLGDGKAGSAIEHRVALSVNFGPGVGKTGPAKPAMEDIDSLCSPGESPPCNLMRR